MLPVELLGILPHHKVVDMCASPGSKTRQILQKLAYPDTAPRNRGGEGWARGGRRGGGGQEEGGTGGLGFVVANDINGQRCRCVCVCVCVSVPVFLCLFLSL
jgi:16S rRNA C967 or C1407 C5-methylase (RsmB/RsmF family)